jgi:hypothetical protein
VKQMVSYFLLVLIKKVNKMDVSADEKQRIREKIEKLKQSKFKQQTLPAWRPVPTAMSTMLTFSIFSVIFLAIGVVL